MTLGYPQDKATIDAKAGQYALALREALRMVQIFETYLLATPDANLVSLGYSQAEVNTLKSAYGDLNKLATIYLGTGTQATTYDFTQFSKLVIGPN